MIAVSAQMEVFYSALAKLIETETLSPSVFFCYKLNTSCCKIYKLKKLDHYYSVFNLILYDFTRIYSNKQQTSLLVEYQSAKKQRKPEKKLKRMKLY